MTRRPERPFSTGCLIIFCVCLSKISFGQIVNVDSSSQQAALNNAVSLYSNALNIQAPVYSGPEYYFYDPHFKGNAYFMDVNGFTEGSISYDGVVYNHISMLYDLNTDQVVVLLPNHVSKFSLIKERVNYFNFLGHHFININPDMLINNTILKPGYYDQLYDGKSEILVRRSKSIQTTTSGLSGLETYFSPSKDFYIKKNNVYFIVNGKGTFLNFFKDRKKEIRQYIKVNNIVYRENPEDAMVKIATYYDHLKN